MPKKDLEPQFREEKLKNWKAHRKAFERNAAFDLIARATDLLVAVVCLVFALVDHSYAPMTPAFGWSLSRLLSRIARPDSR